MLIRARLLDAEEVRSAGFVAERADEGELDATVARIADRLCTQAPLTMWAAKESVRRLRLANLPDGDDIVRTVYGSDDFRADVEGFMTKSLPEWSGR